MAVEMSLTIDTGREQVTSSISSFSLGVTHVATTGGQTAGRPQFDGVSIQRLLDAFSPVLFRASAEGTHFPTVTIAMRKSGGSGGTAGAPFLVYKFGTVFTTKVQWSNSDDGPKEDITFVYGTLIVQYYPQKPDGSNEAVVEVGWDLKTNRVI